MSVKLISYTQVDKNYILNHLQNSAPEFQNHVLKHEGLIAYIARVSSPNPTNTSYSSLLKYCAENNHWSIFEMLDMTFEINTTRAIAAQLLRHKSFSFQEFSQRYSKADSYEIYEARSQDLKNRQNSNDDMDEDIKQWFNNTQKTIFEECFKQYQIALDKGIAKECARSLLPLNTQTKLYMKGSIRSWIHYLNVRCDKSTQLEHRLIANEIKDIFINNLPIIADAVGFKYEE